VFERPTVQVACVFRIIATVDGSLTINAVIC
jgi:hypothetical protein